MKRWVPGEKTFDSPAIAFPITFSGTSNIVKLYNSLEKLVPLTQVFHAKCWNVVDVVNYIWMLKYQKKIICVHLAYFIIIKYM